MIRISGVTLPDHKKVAFGLAAIVGIGRQNVVGILAKAEVDEAKRIKELTSEEVARLQKVIDEFPVEGVLKKKISQDIQRLKTINTYRGLRHTAGLPSRGQQTRSNARTRRGRRMTIGAMKKDDRAKTEVDSKTKETK